MNIYAIKSDDTGDKVLAYLLYFEKVKQFYIELPDFANEWDTPLLLSSFVKRGKRTVNPYWSREWVRQRIIPSDRQNIGNILKANGLKEYDEHKLLLLADGRCAQDDCYIEPLKEEDLPDEIRKRFLTRVEDVIPSTDNSILVFFRDGTVKKCSLKPLCKDSRFEPILNNSSLLSSVKVQTDGLGITWGDNLDITAEELYANGRKYNLSLTDFQSYAATCITDTDGACALLNCSRQNISDLVKRGKLHPIRTFTSGYLFLLREIRHRLWQ